MFFELLGSAPFLVFFIFGRVVKCTLIRFPISHRKVRLGVLNEAWKVIFNCKNGANEKFQAIIIAARKCFVPNVFFLRYVKKQLKQILKNDNMIFRVNFIYIKPCLEFACKP